jgi:uncharacterized SAM-binding protein YcdF (DUF218 family)
MFHILSKLLQFLTYPLTWIFILLLWSWLAKNPKRKRRLMIAGVLVLYLFSNAFVQDEVNLLWEPELSSRKLQKRYSACVVLGGYSDIAPRSGQVAISEAGDRLTEAVWLYHNRFAQKIILSGGAGSLMDFRGQEAAYIGKYLRETGIPKRNIFIDSVSKNTYQNAIECAKLLRHLGLQDTVLLITSTTHMPRAAACFRKAGILVKPYCTDGMTGERKYYVDHLLLPKAEVLSRWNYIIHEWIGYVVYKIMGYA